MENQKFTYKQMVDFKALPLEEKEMMAISLISKEIKNSKRPIVSNSWGKDSMVVLHLVRRVCKNVTVVFHNTYVQYPETYKYRDLMLKEWNIKNYVETKPIKTFWECVKKYGYPKFRQMGKGKDKKYKSQGGARTPKCCYYLKEKPAMDFIKLNNIDLEFLGLQASESMVRRLSFFREGFVFDSKKYKARICRPVMCWTDKDVWEYHKKYNIPKNPTYNTMKRNGCMPCTAFKNWEKVMATANPAMYAFVSKEMGQPLLNEWCEEK